MDRTDAPPYGQGRTGFQVGGSKEKRCVGMDVGVYADGGMVKACIINSLETVLWDGRGCAESQFKYFQVLSIFWGLQPEAG